MNSKATFHLTKFDQFCYCFVILIFILQYIPLASCHSITTVQCPSEHYISKFSSAYDGNERFYKFGCSRFSSKLESFNEECTVTETASTENGDMFMSCGGDQYTAGVQVVDELAWGVNSWQLLCCRSASIKIRSEDCIDTKFINDNRRASTFSSSAQIIRRWQAMPENGDMRWWLQICPVDVILKKLRIASDIRAKRQMPWEWTLGRFPSSMQNYNPFLNEHIRREEERNRWLLENSKNYLFDQNHVNFLSTNTENMNHQHETVQTTQPTISISPTSTTTKPTLDSTPTRLIRKSKTHNERGYRSRIITPPIPTSYATAKAAGEKPLEALDYYDMYDDNFDKKKHTEGGLLKGVSEFLQNIQDGLTLAQAVFPVDKNQQQNKDFHFRLEITPPTPVRRKPNMMFSDDEDHLQIGPFVQKSDRQNSGSPSAIQSTTPVSQILPKREVNSIEGMLQMIGLCQNHAEL